MTTHHREIHAPAENPYAPCRHCFIAAFVIATLGVATDAGPITFNDPTPTDRNHFGYKVALDGNNVLRRGRRGQVHLFDAVTGTLLQTFDNPTPTDRNSFSSFGTSVALDGNHVLIGVTGDGTLGFGVGQAHLFDAVTGSLLRTFNDPTVTERDRFGVSVALDGNNVLVGAFENSTLGDRVGQAHLFTIPEPSSFVLAALALVALLGFARRERLRV